jgi:spore germination protein YaaH
VVRRFRIVAFTILLAWPVTVIAGAPVVEASSAPPGLALWGFYVNYDPTSRSSLLTHLNSIDVVVPNYYGLQADGTVDGNPDPNLDATITATGKQLLPMVQNRISNNALTPFLNDPVRRSNLVRGVTRIAAGTNYSGVTLDFEDVNPSDRAGLSELVRELAASLHAQGKHLAVAVPASTGDLTDSWSGAYDYSSIGNTADWVIVMAYGFRTARATPGPISPLSWFAAAGAYAASTLPADRTILGIGAWGYDWDTATPGEATALRFDQTSALIGATHGQLSYDSIDAAAAYSYQVGSHSHQVWYETARSIAPKVAIARQRGLRGIAIWRLGQEDPLLWQSLDVIAEGDHAIPNGWFYSQTGGGTGLGYRVYDDSIRFWSEFKRLGGIATLGYPASRRYVGADGFTYQVFQRGILQWRPELGAAVLANSFDQLTAARQDSILAHQGIPPPTGDDGSNGDWQKARVTRLSWLTQPDIARAFYANPNSSAIPTWEVDSSIQLYGLPASPPVRSGPFIVQRFQRISLQLWVDSVPGMPAPGSVVGILGGDLVKGSGIVPFAASQPEDSGP